MTDKLTIDSGASKPSQPTLTAHSELMWGDHIMQTWQGYQEAPAFVQMPVKTRHGRIARRRTVRKGGHIFGQSMPLADACMVASGEVLILRDGLPVDLVEAGELLDPTIWSNATAIARTDCTLAPRPVAA